MIAMLTALFTLLGAIVGGVVWWMKQNKSIPAKIAEKEKEQNERYEVYQTMVRSNDPQRYVVLDDIRKLSAEIASLRERQSTGLLSRLK